MQQLKKFYFFFCRNFYKSIILLAFLSFIAAVLELIGLAPLIKIFSFISSKSAFYDDPSTQKIIQLFNLNSDTKIFIFFIFTSFFVFSVKNLFMIFHQRYTTCFLINLRNYVGNVFVEKLLKAPYSFFLTKSSDDLVNTIDNTIRYVIMLYMNFVIQFFVYIVLGIVLLAFILYAFFSPAIISIGVIGFLVYIQIKNFKKITSYISSETTNANTRNVYVIQKIIHAIKEIKILRSQKYVFNHFKKSSSLVSSTEQQGIYVQYVQSFFAEMIIFAGLFAFLLSLIYFNGTERIVCDLALLVTVFFRSAPALNRILSAYGSMKAYHGSLLSLNNEYEALLAASEKETFNNKRKPILFSNRIRLNNIEFTYANAEKPVLKNISIEIKRGEFVGIVGSSGAGKTTLINILLGLLPPSSGTYYIDNTLITKENALNATHLFGYVPQSPFIDSGSIANNIGFCEEKIDMKRIKQLIQTCSLTEFDPHHMIKENGKTLSGGQCQRIALARALYRNPKILILDEATSALDNKTENKIIQFINSLKGQYTIISVAHRLTSLKHCDKILFLREGEVAGFNTFQDLQQQNSDFAEMVSLAKIKS